MTDLYALQQQFDEEAAARRAVHRARAAMARTSSTGTLPLQLLGACALATILLPALLGAFGLMPQ